MQRASNLFSAADQRAISEAVQAAEARTSGEILPVVATVSGRYGRAESLWGVVVAAASLALVWGTCQGYHHGPGGWGAGEPRLRLGLPWILAVLAAGFLLGQLLAGVLPALRQLLATRQEKAEEVERSARAAFQRFGVRRTVARTGVLIYISLAERMVRILPDAAIETAVDPGAWQELVDLLAAGMAEGRHTEALVEVIGRVGALLETPFPHQPDDVDELSNELRLLD
jgi:putative membrane protein